MSLEQQLFFDISRCSYCPLGANKNFCTPTISHQSEYVILLDSPNMNACDDNNGWRHSVASFISKAISYASGSSMEKYHLTFLMKCHSQLSGNSPSVKDKKKWGRVCASHYLEWELKGLKPKKVLFFSEMATQVCFPNHTGPWLDLIGKTLHLNPLQIEAHVFESSGMIVSKGGLSSDTGRDFIQRLHTVLGGKLTLPDVEQEANLFDFF